jgi:hypothetical protein
MKYEEVAMSPEDRKLLALAKKFLNFFMIKREE